nr:immunoglobulin light chain junction region [Macaca mulatta]MOW39278.1 immunoglobulin light chain junction region [Macaca mulatta]MOW39308.1 immunoglobulin light chain junction region [Macaca mulatta]MOW39451.1 immunoglobulin light chain junction region [Macaca mulatta]MOW40305.1 immunoglobulin light chain junction region [Macaca mulatta]
CQNYNESPYSF